MTTAPKTLLKSFVRSVCEDSLFVLASLHRPETELLQQLAQRRLDYYGSVLCGTASDQPPWDRWLISMCVALAPIASPLWLPMHQLVDALTLESGARGVRSLFTSKPSEKQVQRTRAFGAFALRLMTTVQNVDHVLSEQEKLLRQCLVSALGLPEPEALVLLEEPPVPLENIEVPKEVEPRLLSLCMRGLWETAFRDGLDPYEDSMAIKLGQKLGIAEQEVETLRRDVRAELDAGHVLGGAAVDAVRYVLSDEPMTAAHLARITAQLALPPVHQLEPLSVIDHGGPIILARRHALDRADRETCLMLAWLAALSTDPSQSRTAELAARHDRIASDLGSKSEGASTRAAALSFLQDQLRWAVQSAGL